MNLVQRIVTKNRLACAAVIVAAGSGERMKGVDKIMAPVGGIPVIAHTISAFEAAECIDEIILVARQGQIEDMHRIIEERGFKKVAAVVPGGETRVESVLSGLGAMSRGVDLVAVQDGARPLVPTSVIESAVKQAYRCHAAAPAVPVSDTIKEVDETGRVAATPNRSVLRAVQTPQVFQKDLLLAAWKKARKENKTYTDDCSALEALGVPVYLIEGSQESLKITTQLDLRIAEIILETREARKEKVEEKMAEMEESRQAEKLRKRYEKQRDKLRRQEQQRLEKELEEKEKARRREQKAREKARRKAEKSGAKEPVAAGTGEEKPT